jgi:hypothetical protein
MITYELAIEFDVTRRIGWSDDDLGRHIDDVFERLHQARGMLSIDGTADLDTGRSVIAMRYTDLLEDDPEHAGRVILGVAIRACGAGHQGLLPFAEEARARPERNQWSGLRTPMWSVRQVTTSEVSTHG